jgi:hypothetical protein
VLSLIALFVALGGVSYGLAGKNTVASDDIINGGVKSKDIKNSGVKSKDLNTGSVKSSDVQDDSLGGGDINENTLGKVPRASEADKATNADNADDADALGGSPPGAFASSTIVRWAEIGADGTIGDSSGITQANIDKRGTGFYCLGGLNPAPKAGTATLTGTVAFGQIFVAVSDGACTDNQVGIFTYDNSNTSINNAFTVVVY